MQSTQDATSTHVFERAGLGVAPFRVVGVERRVGPITHDSGLIVGAPGQPMGSCEYCGQGIALCFSIKSSDGRRFIVGSECVAKAGDNGLKRQMNPLLAKLRHESDDARIAKAQRLIARDDVRAALIDQQAPKPSKSANALDWAEWMMANAGRAGKIRVARVVEKTMARGEA